MGRRGYSPELKESILQSFQSPNPPSVAEISANTGISPKTLYLWRRESQGSATSPQSPHLRSADEKWRLITQAEQLTGQDLGGFLRGEGLHLAQLDQWRAEVMKALKAMSPQRKSKEERAAAKRIRELEAELRRKDAALAEAAALLLLAKKAEALWGGEDDATAPKSGRGSST